MNTSIFPPVPMDTAKVARAVLQNNNFFITVGDLSTSLFSGLCLMDAFNRIQETEQTLARLYLITVFEFVESLPDQQAAEALRQRVDWKYALHLPLNHPGLEAPIFCEFRKWLLADPTGRQTLNTLLMRLAGTGMLAGQEQANLESMPIIKLVCTLSRLQEVWDSMSQALEALAILRPEWLRLISLPRWYGRYGNHHKQLSSRVANRSQEELALAIGRDGFYLLKAIVEAGEPELMDLPEVLRLQRVWQKQYETTQGELRWRIETCAGCSFPGRQDCSVNQDMQTL